MATVSDGSVYITGTTDGDLDGETNAGFYDAFLTKYSSDGTKAWTKLLGDSEFDYSREVATASDGSIFITGYTRGDLDGETNAGDFDAFLTKYSSDGTKAWTKLLGSSSSDRGYGVATASDGSIFITGYTEGNLDGETNAGSYDIFVSKYSSDGTKAWTKLIGTSSSEKGNGVATASDGSIFITGYTFGDLDGETNAGSSDAFLMKLAEAYAVNSDSGYATYSITGTRAAGNVLTAAVYTDDPEGNGTVSSYQWQSSADGSTDWTAISGATSSTYTLTEAEEGKYVRVIIVYTDGSGNETTLTVSLSKAISQMHTEWVQPYAAMQNVGLKSIHNNRDLVLEKAGECNNKGWVIGDSDYCLYTNTNNIVSYVKGDSTKGSYRSTVFNSSLNLEKTLNDTWKAGIAYGVGSSNLNNFNFSNTTASFGSTNTHYSIYGVKKVNDTFTLKGMIGGSDFDYKGKRNYSTTSATSAYDSDGYTAEINGIWDIKKTIKNMKTPFRLKPSVGVAYAAHTQEGFSESGSGDLITIDANQAESLLFKTGISIDKQISMEGGKWLLVPSLALNYEMDTYAENSNRSIKGGLTESSTEHTSVSAKTFGKHNSSLEVGADFVLTKDFMFNLKGEYGLAEGGDEYAYGGGFRWQF